MMKIFRNIRQKLAAENKVMAYLRYAVGEIFLVVIGILIALQVNNWNEARKDRNQERRFLERFEAEINSDIENISGSIFANKDRMHRAEFLMASIDKPRLAADSSTYFIQSIEYAGYTYIPVISDNTFEEIKSSGRLSLISNEKLRSALQDYYSWSSNWGQYNFIRRDIQLNYLHEQRGILSPSQQIDMGNFKTSKHYSPAEAKQVYKRMMKKPGFMALLPIIIQGQTRNAENFEDIKQQAKNLVAKIENELGGQKTNEASLERNNKQ